MHPMNRTLLCLLAAPLLAGCVGGLISGNRSASGVIAAPMDTGNDDNFLASGRAAIVYDPDGCQAWLIDDGIEGYSGRRFDPITGLPVCDSLYPPGTVIGVYETGDPGIRDFVPGR